VLDRIRVAAKCGAWAAGALALGSLARSCAAPMGA